MSWNTESLQPNNLFNLSGLQTFLSSVFLHNAFLKYLKRSKNKNNLLKKFFSRKTSRNVYSYPFFTAKNFNEFGFYKPVINFGKVYFQIFSIFIWLNFMNWQPSLLKRIFLYEVSFKSFFLTVAIFKVQLWFICSCTINFNLFCIKLCINTYFNSYITMLFKFSRIMSKHYSCPNTSMFPF